MNNVEFKIKNMKTDCFPFNSLKIRAICNNRSAGCSLVSNTKLGIIINLLVNNDFRGNGIGNALLEETVKVIKDNLSIFSSERIFTSYEGSNPALKRILTKNGFLMEAHRKNIVKYVNGEKMYTTISEFVLDLTPQSNLPEKRYADLYNNRIYDIMSSAIAAESSEEAYAIIEDIPDVITDNTPENEVGNAIKDDVKNEISNIFNSQMESYANNVNNNEPYRVSDLIRELSADNIDPNAEVYLQVNDGIAFNYTYPLRGIVGTSKSNFVCQGVDIYFPYISTEKTRNMMTVVLS